IVESARLAVGPQLPHHRALSGSIHAFDDEKKSGKVGLEHSGDRYFRSEWSTKDTKDTKKEDVGRQSVPESIVVGILRTRNAGAWARGKCRSPVGVGTRAVECWQLSFPARSRPISHATPPSGGTPLPL